MQIFHQLLNGTQFQNYQIFQEAKTKHGLLIDVF